MSASAKQTFSKLTTSDKVPTAVQPAQDSAALQCHTELRVCMQPPKGLLRLKDKFLTWQPMHHLTYVMSTSFSIHRERQKLIESLQHPAPGSEPLKFSSKYARSIPQQFLIILKKFFTLYNRMPEYNAGESVLSAQED